MIPAGKVHPTFERIAVLSILLLGFGLRAYQLDFQSFWSDEGISLLRSSAPIGQMLQEMPVEHMPGYFVLLHYWLRVAGTHDWGVRFLSLWPSVLAIALLFRLSVALCKQIYNEQTDASTSRPFAIASGLGSAALLATAAFQIWYAQEARMYSWLLASGLASYFLCWQLIRRDTEQLLPEKQTGADSQPSRTSRLILIGYVLTTALSVYLHFYGFLVPLTQAVFVCGWVLATREWQAFRRWILAGALTFGLFLPWLPRALGIFEFSGWRAAGDPWQIPLRYFTAYTVGEALLPPTRDWYIWGYALLAVVGLLGWFRQRLTAGFFVLCGIGIPMAAVIAFAVNNPDFHERYSIIVSPFIALAVGGSFGLLTQVGSVAKAATWLLPVAILSTLIFGSGLSLQNQLNDTSLHKPDFRGAAWRIAQNEEAGDVILVDGPDPEKVFLHYYGGSAPVHDLRSLEGESWETVSEALQEKTAGAGRIWELLYFHGPGLVQTWTATNGWATDPTYHNNIRVTLYGAVGNETTMLSKATIHNVDFGAGLTLMQSEINGTEFAAGDLVRVSTVWQVNEQLPDYKFSLRVLHEDGSIARSWDYIPQNWIAPTTMWIVGSQATDKHGFVIPPELPDGPYNVTLRLYDPTNGVPVDTQAGQDVLLREIRIGH